MAQPINPTPPQPIKSEKAEAVVASVQVPPPLTAQVPFLEPSPVNRIPEPRPEIALKDQDCSNCRYFKGTNGTVGLCRFNPPRDGAFPGCDAMQWCGQWRGMNN